MGTLAAATSRASGQLVSFRHYTSAEGLPQARVVAVQQHAPPPGGGEPDVVALRPGGPDLSPFHTATLLQAPVIVLDRPGPLGQAQSRQLVHRGRA